MNSALMSIKQQHDLLRLVYYTRSDPPNNLGTTSMFMAEVVSRTQACTWWHKPSAKSPGNA